MPLDTFLEGRDAVRARFKAEWDAQSPPVPRVIYDRTLQDTPDGAEEWAEVLVRYNGAGQRTLGGPGNRRFSRVGLVVVKVRTPRSLNDGGVRNDALVEVAVRAFEGKSAGGTSDAVTFTNVRADDFGPDGPWDVTNVLADFEFEAVK